MMGNSGFSISKNDEKLLQSGILKLQRMQTIKDDAFKRQTTGKVFNDDDFKRLTTGEGNVSPSPVKSDLTNL